MRWSSLWAHLEDVKGCWLFQAEAERNGKSGEGAAGSEQCSHEHPPPVLEGFEPYMPHTLLCKASVCDQTGAEARWCPCPGTRLSALPAHLGSPHVYATNGTIICEITFYKKLTGMGHIVVTVPLSKIRVVEPTLHLTSSRSPVAASLLSLSYHCNGQLSALSLPATDRIMHLSALCKDKKLAGR
jgi:hypothetical protein